MPKIKINLGIDLSIVDDINVCDGFDFTVLGRVGPSSIIVVNTKDAGNEEATRYALTLGPAGVSVCDNFFKIPFRMTGTADGSKWSGTVTFESVDLCD